MTRLFRAFANVLSEYNGDLQSEALDDLVNAIRVALSARDAGIDTGLRLMSGLARAAPGTNYFPRKEFQDLPTSFFRLLIEFFCRDAGVNREVCKIRGRLRQLNKAIAAKTESLPCLNHRKARANAPGPVERYKALRFFAADRPGDGEWRCLKQMKAEMLQCDIESFLYLEDVGVCLSEVRRLTLMGNIPLQCGALPTGITQITFDPSFNQPLEPGHLPSTITHVTFGENFNQPLLPNSLVGVTALEFGDRFDSRIAPGALPLTLKRLRFGAAYNQMVSVGQIPGGVTRLAFGSSFDQPLCVGVLPARLRDLRFGDDFNQPVLEGVLPRGLEVLVFGDSFNHYICPGTLPQSLRKLVFGFGFDKPLVEDAELSEKARRSPPALFFRSDTRRSPSKGGRTARSNEPGVLATAPPPTIGRLRLVQSKPTKVLPSRLKTLHIGDKYSHSLDGGVLPASLRRVRLPETALGYVYCLEGLQELESLVVGPHSYVL